MAFTKGIGATMNNRTKSKIATLTILALCPPLRAQSGGGFNLTWSTLDGGGGMNGTGGPFTLSGTIGQPDAASNPTLTGGTFELTGGFWPVTQACFCLGDMNHDGKKDGLDVQQFVACILAGGDCACADVDQVNGVTVADVAPFVADLLAGATCP